MPTYNGRSRGFIDQALASIQRQSLAPSEVIVVDDGSTDDTRSYIASTYPSINLLHQENAGPSAARNLALRHTTGDFVVYLDDDDEWEPNKIERQVAFLNQHPEFGFTGCGMIYIDEHSQEVSRELPTPWGCHYPESILGNGFLPPSTLMFRKSLLEKVGDWNTHLRMGEDFELCFRCTKVAQVGFQMEYLTRYRQHGNQSCNDLSKIDENTIEIITRLAANDFPDQKQKILRYYTYGAACRALFRRDFKFFYKVLGRESGVPNFIELALRFFGVILAPFPKWKRKWRLWESKRIFGTLKAN